MNKFYRDGDYLVICDRSGQKVLRSQCVKEWNGLIVKKEFSEPRHPLDHERPIPPERPVMDARPPATDYFLSDGEVSIDDL